MTAAVFLGSTFVDLERHRALIRDAITRLEQNLKAMEFFGALPETPKDECLRLVRSANLYVGVFGMRYGHIDEASGKSLTQLEYEEAQAIRLPSLIYVMDENTHAVLPKHVDTGISADKLKSFKPKQGSVCTFGRGAGFLGYSACPIRQSQIQVVPPGSCSNSIVIRYQGQPIPKRLGDFHRGTGTEEG